MFRDHTVVIIGAGASAEAGLPIGSKLKDDISRLTDVKTEFGDLVRGNKAFIRELKQLDCFAGDWERLTAACTKVSAGVGFVSSIDNFLEIHADDADVQICAKCAITYLISREEQESKLAVDRSNRYNRLSSSALAETWYQGLAHVLFEKVPATDIGAAFEKVDFISFNYDRCLEWFLYQSVMGIYAVNNAEALALLAPVKVHHPYGQIGRSGWDAVVDSFGNDLSGRVAHIADKIKTYTEKLETSDVDDIRRTVQLADNILFLGFAFHPQNINLLQSQDLKPFAKSKNIYFTSYGMSENDAVQVAVELSQCFTRHSAGYTPANVTPANLKCWQFLERYKRTLSI